MFSLGREVVRKVYQFALGALSCVSSTNCLTVKRRLGARRLICSRRTKLCVFYQLSACEAPTRCAAALRTRGAARFGVQGPALVRPVRFTICQSCSCNCVRRKSVVHRFDGRHHRVSKQVHAPCAAAAAPCLLVCLIGTTAPGSRA